MSLPIRSAAVALAAAAAACTFAMSGTAGAAASHPSASPAARARPTDTDPAPSCSDNNNTVPCWEYQTWYWTYANCNNAGTAAVDSSHGKFDNHVCVLTSNGVGVGLWLHKLHD